MVKQFDIYLIGLDPTIGSEIQKARPCTVISPNEMNRHLRTVIVAPITTSTNKYPTRVPVVFNNKNGLITLDQIRTVDKKRLIKKIGKLPTNTSKNTLSTLVEMFS